MYCPNCSCALPAIAKFCVRCGAPTGFVAVGPDTQPYVSTPVGPGPGAGPDRAGDYAHCGRCGTKVIVGNQFCTACGNPLRVDAALVPTPLHAPSVPESTRMTDFSKHGSSASQAPASIGQAGAIKTPISTTTGTISESRRAKFPEIEASPSNTQAKGSLFVVRPGGLLPNRCVKCGSAPSEPWLDLTFFWHHPALFLLLVSPIIYLIVSLIVGKKVTLAVPLCAAHKQHIKGSERSDSGPAGCC